MVVMQDTVVIAANRWHQICHELEFDSVDRKHEFEECFNCVVHWRSGLQEWGGDPDSRPEPTMVLRFLNPHDAVVFALKWA